MRTDLPTSVSDTMHDLAPDALVKLYRIELTDSTQFHLSPQGEVTWQGNTYDPVPCNLVEVSRDANGKATRPKFSFANPEGLFSYEISTGQLDYATITRYRILKADLDADNDFKITEQFRVSRILNLNKDLASVELRDVLDGHSFKLPARAYYPPEFPHVRLR